MYYKTTEFNRARIELSPFIYFNTMYLQSFIIFGWFPTFPVIKISCKFPFQTPVYLKKLVKILDVDSISVYVCTGTRDRRKVYFLESKRISIFVDFRTWRELNTPFFFTLIKLWQFDTNYTPCLSKRSLLSRRNVYKLTRVNHKWLNLYEPIMCFLRYLLVFK